MTKAEDTRRTILDAAEKLFSQAGYNGVPMRAIAADAGVPQGLLHYHFGTKEGLYEAVFARRVEPLVERRLTLLRQCLAKSQKRCPDLEGVMEAFFRPLLELGREEAGVHYSRLIAQVVNATDPLSRNLTRRYFDGMATEYIAALRQALPGLSEADAAWGYFFIMGAGIVSIARSGRIEDLSKGVCRSDDLDAILVRVVPYCAAGLRALVQAANDISTTTKQGKGRKRHA